MNKTPITDACFLAQGEPPEALIERLAKCSRKLELALSELRHACDHFSYLKSEYDCDRSNEELGQQLSAASVRLYEAEQVTDALGKENP